MMIYFDDDEPRETTNIVFKGESKSPDKDGERGILEIFKRVLNKLGRTKLGFGFGLDGVNVEFEAERRDKNSTLNEAEAQKARAEAEKFGAEAAEIQARLEEKAFNRVSEVNAELRKIFSDANTPDEIKAIELLNLIGVDPSLAGQVKKIAEKYNTLKLTKGVSIFLPLIAEDESEGTYSSSFEKGDDG